MTATRIGKWLVFVNLFLAVGLFAWALSLYANRPDWFDRTDGDVKVEGQLTRLQAEVKRVSDAIKGAQVGYARAARLLDTKEAERMSRYQVLNNRWLAEVRDENNPNAQFRVIPRQPNSVLAEYREQRPLAPYLGLQGQPLSGLGTLKRKMQDLVRDERAARAAILAARQRLAQASDRVEAVQAEVFKMKDIRNAQKDQEAFLADAQINWDERLKTLKERESQLLGRLREVKGEAVSGGN